MNRQTVGFGAEIIKGHSRQARIHDIADPGNGDGCFGNIGGNHDFCAFARQEDLLLIPCMKSTEKRKYLCIRYFLPQDIAAVADISLRGEENQHVPWRFSGVELPDGTDTTVNIIFKFTVLIRIRWRVAHFNGVGFTRDRDNRGIVEMFGEGLRIYGSRGDNNFQVRALGENILQMAEQEIDIQASLMSFIDNQNVVIGQKSVLPRFGQQHPVRHKFDSGALAGAVLKTDLVSHCMAKLSQFFSHS